MNFAALIDPASAAIVGGGTLLATVLRAGAGDCRATVAALCQLGRPRFDMESARAEMAVQVQEIRRDGLMRAPLHHYGDTEFDEATDAVIVRRSLSGLRDAHTAHRLRRLETSNRAVRTLAQAAELAPVFGLAGTLVSLSQLPQDGLARAALASAIAMAVLTTLYGLLLANIVLAPLARMVERASQAEERDRQQLVDWLAAQLAPAIPAGRPADGAVGRAA